MIKVPSKVFFKRRIFYDIIKWKNIIFSFLNKEHTIAGPGFNRWLVPPAALAIHLCIGMAYGFSVFWLPLSKSLAVSQGLTEAIKCGPE
jgi:hypothetical protein